MSLDQALRNNLLFNDYLTITELLKEHKVFDIVEDYIKESEEIFKQELITEIPNPDIEDDVKLIMKDKTLSDDEILEGLVEICDNENGLFDEFKRFCIDNKNRLKHKWKPINSWSDFWDKRSVM